PTRRSSDLASMSPARWFYARSLRKSAGDGLHQDTGRGGACVPNAALQRRLVIPSRRIAARGLAGLREVHSAARHESLRLVRWRGAAEVRTLQRADVQSEACR